MGDEVQNPLKTAIEGCATDRAACIEGIRAFIEDCYPDAEEIALRHARSYRRGRSEETKDLAEDLLSDLTRRLMRASDHPDHPLVAKYATAENLGGLADVQFKRLAIDAYRKHKRQKRHKAAGAGSALDASVERDDAAAAVLGMIGEEDRPETHLAFDPEDTSRHLDLALESTETFVRTLRTQTDPRRRLVLYACGRPRSNARPFPIGAADLDATERKYLKEHGLTALLNLIGTNAHGRVRQVATILGTSENNVAQLKTRAYEDGLAGVIARAINDPATDLNLRRTVALLAKPLGHVPLCLSDGRHTRNLSASLQPRWTEIRQAFEHPPANWAALGIDPKRVPVLAAEGTRELIAVGLGEA